MEDGTPDTVVDLIARLRTTLPSTPFCRLLHTDREPDILSYTALVGRAAKWATFYRRSGVGRADTVVIVLPHSIELYAAYLGAALLGAVPAMFAYPSAKYSVEEYRRTIDRLLENANPRLVLTYSSLRDLLVGVLTPERAARLTCAPPDLDELEELPLTNNAAPTDVAFLQYSSGTTGLKKGVAITHQALLWQVRNYCASIDRRESDVIVSWLPLYHDMGLVCCFWLPLLTGTPFIAMSAHEWVMRPAVLLQAITRYRPTLCWLPNFAYAFLARTVTDAEVRELELSSLRGLVNCSEPVLAASHHRFLERFQPVGLNPAALATSYAMAECTFAVTSGGFRNGLRNEAVNSDLLVREQRAVPVGASTAGAKILVSSGRALPETAIRIADREGRPLAERRIGEIWIQSPSLLREYYANPDATNAALIDGWFHTGDLGYLAEGELFVTGRSKDLIIVAGKNIFPQDIEDVVSQVEGVIPGRVAALGIADASTGTEQLVVIAESRCIDAAARVALADAIRRKVAADTDLVPADVAIVEHMWLRKSSSGKIARENNRQRYLELRQPPAAPEASESTASCGPDNLAAVERCITAAVAQVLQSKGRVFGGTLTAETPLLRLGLIDSLSIVALAAELENRLGRKLPGRILQTSNFETIAALARAVTSRADADVDSSLPPPITRVQDVAAPGPCALFDSYASLGDNCEAGLQFQRIGYEETGFFRFTASPFASTYRLLDADFAGVFEQGNLVPLADAMVKDRRYEIIFHCDIPSEPLPNGAGFRFVPENFEQSYRLFQKLTIQGLADKWRRVCSSEMRVAYFLKVNDGGAREKAVRLTELFRRNYPAHRYELIVVQTEQYREAPWALPHVHNRYVARFAPSHRAWDADLSGWDKIFAEFPLGVRRDEAQKDVARRLEGAMAEMRRQAEMTIAWRSKAEAAIALEKLGHRTQALSHFLEGIKTVQTCDNPRVLVDALLGIGAEMARLDPNRAKYLLGLAAASAEKLDWGADKQRAEQAIAAISARSASPLDRIATPAKPVAV